MNFARLIIFQARNRLTEPAIATVGGVATYALLAKAVEVTVGRLEAQALPRGALVALSIGDPVRHIAATIALGLMGMRSIAVQTQFNIELAGIAPDLYMTDGEMQLAAGARILRVENSWFQLDPAQAPDFNRLMALPGFESEEDDVHLVLSSGTTGRPKCIGLNSRVIELRCSRALVAAGGAHASAMRIINLMGFSTIAGFQAVAMALGSGGLIAFAQQPTDIVHLIRLFHIEGLGMAVIQSPPLLKYMETQSPLTSLKFVGGAGSRLPKAMLAEMRARLCSNVYLNYGSTEGGVMSIGTGQVLDAEEGTVGYVFPWVELQIVDADGNKLPHDADGIIRFRCDELGHYVVDRDGGEQGFRDGWFYPGDVGRLNVNGLLTLTGRTNEIINRGGVIIAPDLIDEVLRSFPGIKDAAAFGVKNDKGIEEIWAAVVSDSPPDPAKLIAAARAKIVERAPDVIVRVDAIPRNRMGKVEREKLREETVAKLRK